MTILVAITGGIGSGKSTFSEEVLKKKLPLFDSDKEVANIYKKQEKNFLNLLKSIGLEKAIKNKRIDKKLIRETIFTDRESKIKLEKYIFKIVRKKRNKFIKQQKKINSKIAFLDIPLLFENNLSKNFNTVITIISKKKHRIKRLSTSKKINKSTFNMIIKSQTSDIVRKSKSDIIIYNNDTMIKYKNKIKKVLDKILS